MRYLVTARVKPGREADLLRAIEAGTLGAGSVADFFPGWSCQPRIEVERLGLADDDSAKIPVGWIEKVVPFLRHDGARNGEDGMGVACAPAVADFAQRWRGRVIPPAVGEHRNIDLRHQRLIERDGALDELLKEFGGVKVHEDLKRRK